MKYIIIAFGALISGGVCWSILTTPDIPWPILQCILFTSFIVLFVWAVLGVPSIRKTKKDKGILTNIKSTFEKYKNKNKIFLVTLASLLAFVIISGSVLSFILLMSADSKIPSTADEVRAVIISNDYEPTDYTDSYTEKDLSFQLALKECIAFESDDIHFEFFEFNTQEDAENIWRQAYQKITIQYNAWRKIETEYNVANYHIYTLDSLGKYNVAIYVCNTAVYAYCDSENKNEINKILKEIDYLEFGNNKEIVTQ